MTTISVIAEHLKALETADGRLTPQTVVDDARDPRSPTHSHFEWDDTKAAEKHRIDQARQLIRSIKLKVTVRNLLQTPPAYVRDLSLESEGGYRSLGMVAKEEDVARATVIDAMQRVQNAIARAKTLAEVLAVKDLVEEIDLMAESIIQKVKLDPDNPDQLGGTA